MNEQELTNNQILAAEAAYEAFFVQTLSSHSKLAKNTKQVLRSVNPSDLRALSWAEMEFNDIQFDVGQGIEDQQLAAEEAALQNELDNYLWWNHTEDIHEFFDDDDTLSSAMKSMKISGQSNV